jgi:hypothetical protein
MVQTEVVEKVKTQILCSVVFNHAVNEIMCKIIAELDKPQMTI